MKCIGVFSGMFLWVCLILIVWLFVPDTVTVVHDNFSWISGLAIAGWWASGYVLNCSY